MNQKIKIKDLLPNPFRHKDHVIEEGKVEALSRSYESTGVWPTIVGRKKGDKVERAFGDHRVETAKRLYGDDFEIEIQVRKLSDEEMLKMMADENKEEWKTSFAVTMEIVETAIKEYAKGTIKLPEVKSASQGSGVFRCAPSFIKGKRFESTQNVSLYSTESLAEFLNWKAPNQVDPHWSVRIALSAFEQVEKGILKLDHFKGLSIEQASKTIKEIKITEKRIKQDQDIRKEMIKDAKTESEKEELRAKANSVAELPSRVGEAVVAGFKSGNLATRNTRKVTDQITDHKVFKPIAPSSEFIGDLCSSLGSILSPVKDKERLNKIQAVIDARDALPKEQVQRVARYLVDVAEDCIQLATKLNPAIENRVKQIGVKLLPVA